MHKQVLVCALLITLGMVGSALAQTPEKPDSFPPTLNTYTWPTQPGTSPWDEIGFQNPYTQSQDIGAGSWDETGFQQDWGGQQQPDYRFKTGYEQPRDFGLNAVRPTQALLAEIVTWLSTNYDLPGIHNLPRVELVPATRLASLRYKGLLPDQWRENNVNDPAARADFQREVVAVYNDLTKTIFLSESWTGSTPAEQSVLVHEMVHHLQNLGKFKYECPQAREKLAYEAQNEWLKLYGLDLEKEFEIDMFSVLIGSACMN